MTAEKKQDRRIHVISNSITDAITVGTTANNKAPFQFSEDLEAKALTAFNTDRGEEALQLTDEMVKVTDQFKADFRTALVYAAGNPGVTAFKADADLSEINGKFTSGADTITVRQERLFDKANPQFGDEKYPDAAERILKPGRVTVKLDIPGNSAYKRAVSAICEIAGDLL